jgi:hypothetical protein
MGPDAVSAVAAHMQHLERILAEKSAPVSTTYTTFSPKQPPVFTGAMTDNFFKWHKKLTTYFAVR